MKELQKIKSRWKKWKNKYKDKLIYHVPRIKGGRMLKDTLNHQHKLKEIQHDRESNGEAEIGDSLILGRR
jgi:hypothetical protein